MMSKRRTVSGAAVVVAFLGAAGCASGAAGGPASSPASPQMIAAGSELYGARCAGCHGPAGAGTPRGPNLNDDQWIWLTPTTSHRAQIAAIVQNGIPMPRQFMNPMPPVGAQMTEDQRQQIAAYVESL